MDIRKLYYYHKRFAFLKAWYFLAAAVVFALIAVQALRSNYSTMVKMREAVYVADQQNGDVEGALLKLREHVHGHMNTNLTSGNNAIKPPIQLKARYERLMVAENSRVAAANAQVSARAEVQCAQQYPQAGFNAPRVACIQEYVRVNGIKSQPISDSLYKFDFVSPSWSFDRAGMSIIATVIFLALFIARWLLELYMRKRLQ